MERYGDEWIKTQEGKEWLKKEKERKKAEREATRVEWAKKHHDQTGVEAMIIEAMKRANR